MNYPVYPGELQAPKYIQRVTRDAKNRNSPREAQWLLEKTDPQKPLHILHVGGAACSIPAKTYGGAEEVIRSLVDQHRSMGHKVSLYAPGSSTISGVIPTIGQAILESGGKWEHQGKFALHYTLILRDLRLQIKQYGKLPYDFAIVHLTDPYSSVMIGEIIAQLNGHGVPTLVVKHSPLDLPDRFFADGKEKWAPDSIASSAYLDQYWAHVPLIAFGPVDQATTLKQFPTAWVVDQIPLALGDGSFLSQRPRFNDTVGIMGRIQHEKGQADAIEIAKILGLNILVAGPITDPVYFAKRVAPQIDIDLSNDPGQVAALLSGKANHLLSGPPRTIYLGPIGGDNKDNFFARILAFLAPIHWDEPGGTAFIEALAAGTPFVGYERGCVKSQIDPHFGQWGFYVPEWDEQGFMNALKVALNLNNNAQIQRWARQEIHVSKAAQRYDALMRFLIALWWEQGGWQV